MNGTITACASDDKRIDYAARVILNVGGTVIFPSLPADCPNCDGILLPIPTARYLKEKPKDYAILLSHLKKGGIIFTSDTLPFLQGYEDYKIKCYSEDEDFININTIATCEGALSLLISSTSRTLRCSKVLITGWGRLAKCLFHILKKLDADLTLCARSRQARAEILSLGCECGSMDDLPRLIGGADIIINTVPARIIDHSAITSSVRNKLFLELASAPYGYDEKALKELGAICIPAPSLPSRFAPESSGIALGRAVCRLYSVDNTI